MSFRETTMYRVICDGCGACAQDAGDFYAWADKDQAETEANSGDWLCRDDGHWCPDCTAWDDEADERVPKPQVTPLPRPLRSEARAQKGPGEGSPGEQRFTGT